MLVQINLLPWREQQRKREKNQLIAWFVAVILIVMLFTVLVNFVISNWTKNQEIRNQMLQQEIKIYEQRSKEIKDMKIQRQNLISQMASIDQLQTRQELMIHLFDELSMVLSEGIILISMEKRNSKIILSGYAQTHNDIAQAMKNMEVNSWLHNPELLGIKKKLHQSPIMGSEFKLSFTLGIESIKEKNG